MPVFCSVLPWLLLKLSVFTVVNLMILSEMERPDQGSKGSYAEVATRPFSWIISTTLTDQVYMTGLSG